MAHADDYDAEGNEAAIPEPRMNDEDEAMAAYEEEYGGMW